MLDRKQINQKMLETIQLQIDTIRDEVVRMQENTKELQLNLQQSETGLRLLAQKLDKYIWYGSG